MRHGMQSGRMMDENKMGIGERMVNQIMLQAMRDLCSLCNVVGLHCGSINEKGCGRAPHTTLNMITPP